MIFSKDQIILVTGASSGIGRAIASQCVEEGATVLANGRDSKKLEAAKNACAAPERWISLAKDLLEDLPNLADWTKNLAKEYGKLYGLAHCAGMGSMDTLRTFSLDLSRHIFDLNFQAPILLAQGFADRRVHIKNGSMVFITSAAAVFPESGHLLYGASKAALASAVKSISQEIASLGLRANCLSPGIVETPMEDAAEALMGPGYREGQLKGYPLGFGKPQDVANFAIFLLSGNSRWITGQNYVLAGGRY